jgi:hypothetical protein
MATIYRKTAKGQAEFETRANRLPPRLRTALILVDGRRDTDQLSGLIVQDPALTLQMLIEDGFIEAIGETPSRPAISAPAPASPPMPASAMVGKPSPLAFEQRRSDALRYFNDQAGPVGEAAAMRIEKCRDWQQLLPELQYAQRLLTHLNGADVASEFGSRFIDAPVT